MSSNITRLPPQSDPPLSPRQTLPTMYDLPSENREDSGLPDEYHCYQPSLLRQTFKPAHWESEEVFMASDLNLYYDVRHPNWYKRPDWFAVLGVPRLYDGENLRLSYVMWQELVSPFVVIELLSPATEDEDLGRNFRPRGNPPTKWYVYEQILRVPYYIVFSGVTRVMQVFRLVAGVYEPTEIVRDRVPIPQLELSLGLWQGNYENINRTWLRWFKLSGELILTPTEEAEKRAEKLATKLRELNIDPDQLD
jgi:Uma2 family endonuclease